MSPQAPLSKLYHCVYALHYHLVVVTKCRRRCLTAAMLERLRAIAARCKGWGGELLELNGEPDHVHLLVSLPPNAELSRFVNNLKTTSSRLLLHKEFAEELNRVYRKPVLWSRSYRIVTCGGAPWAIPRRYIEQQGEPD